MLQVGDTVSWPDCFKNRPAQMGVVVGSKEGSLTVVDFLGCTTVWAPEDEFTFVGPAVNIEALEQVVARLKAEKATMERNL